MADNDGGISDSAEIKGMHSSDKSFTFVRETNFREHQSTQLITDGLHKLVWVNGQDRITQHLAFGKCSHVTPRFTDSITPNAGAAPVEANQRQSRPSSINKGRARPKSLGHTLHWFAYVGQEPEFEPDCYDYDCDDSAGAALSTLEEPPLDPNNSGDAGSRDGGAASQDREERARLTRERQNSERARKLEELRAQALSAQRFREQKEEERRRRIDEMRSRDNDRRHQVEERKRAIWEAERERREAIVRRNEEREARLEGRRRGGGANAVGVFAFGSSTPRMLEPADTGGTFWGHRRATSTSNVMFAALPLSRRSSERELDPNKKRATSASGLDRQAGDDYRVSATTMYDVFHWDAFGAGPSEGASSSHQREIFPVQFSGFKEESGGDGAPWSRVARRRTDLVPTLTSAPRSEHRTPRSPGRAYSMTRLDQLSQPRKQSVLVAVDITSGGGGPGPVRPPRHRSSGQLSRAAGHRSVGNLLVAVGPAPPPRRHAVKTSPGQTASGLRSGEVTPGSPSRPGSSLSSASTLAGSTSAAMTSSVMGTLVNRRPRAAPRRPRPASIAGTGVTTPPHVKTNTVGADGKLIGLRAEKPPLPRVHTATPAHKKHPPTGPPAAAVMASQDKPEVPKRAHKGGSVKASPRITPRTTPLQSPASDLPPSVLQDVQEGTAMEQEESNDVSLISSDSQVTSASLTESTSTITETVKQVTKEVIIQPGGEENKLTTVTTVNNNGDTVQSVTTETLISAVVAEGKPEAVAVVEVAKKAKEDAVEVTEKKETLAPDALEVADMTASMSARSRGAITTEEEAKAALAERRRLAREEAERAAERERLRLEKEEEEEEERQRQEEERQRRLEEETIRLSELQRQSEEERLQQAILEAQRFKEEEVQRKELELRARAEREVADAKAREEAERTRQETAERLRKEDEEREARRRRVEAIMLRTRQAKQKKDGDKSPTEENKSLEDTDQKFIENKMAPELSQQQQAVDSVGQLDRESAYELSVRQREEALLCHTAPHNLATPINGVNSFQNGAPLAPGNGAPPTNGTAPPSNGDSGKERELSQANSHYPVQNGHSKSQMNELNNFINTNSENQYNNVALDNAVIQNNVTNNLLDISEVDLLNTNKNNPFLLDINTNSMATSNSNGGLLQQTEGQMLDLSTDSISKNFVNEDSMNSNQTLNSPFITSFQDNQENRDVSLL